MEQLTISVRTGRMDGNAFFIMGVVTWSHFGALLDGNDRTNLRITAVVTGLK